MLADRQTDRQTDRETGTLITYFAPVPEAEYYRQSGFLYATLQIIAQLLARRSMSEAFMLRAFRLDHLRTCEQWPHP